MSDIPALPDTPTNPSPGSILIVGASRGLGHAIAEQYLRRGWDVTGTVRAAAGTPLHALAAAFPGRVAIETVDVRDPDAIAVLRARLAGARFDILFVNPGTSNDPNQRIGEVDTAEFDRVMQTNALGPMRAVERLHDLVPPDGLVGVMSSGQGSVTNNRNGMRELYRGSKAALNMFMRSFAAREEHAGRAMVLIAPGWVRTELGGADAPLAIADSVPRLVQVLLDARGTPGLRYLDYLGRTVPW